MFINVERRGIALTSNNYTKGYPTDVDTIVSDEDTVLTRTLRLPPSIVSLVHGGFQVYDCLSADH